MDIRDPKDKPQEEVIPQGPGRFADQYKGMVPNEAISSEDEGGSLEITPIANRLGLGPLAKMYYGTKLGQIDRSMQESIKNNLPGILTGRIEPSGNMIKDIAKSIPSALIQGTGDMLKTMVPNIHDLRYNSAPGRSTASKIVEGAFQPVKGFYFGDEDPGEIALKASKGDPGSIAELAIAASLAPGAKPIKRLKGILGKASESAGKTPTGFKVKELKKSWDDTMDLGWSRTVNYLTDPTQSILESGTAKGIPQAVMTTVQKGGKFAREKLQPAVERLNLGGQATIRKSHADAYKLRTETDLLGNILSKPEVTLTDKLDFARLNRGEAVDNPKMQQVLKDSKARLKRQGIDPRANQAFEEQMGKMYTEMFQSTDDIANAELRKFLTAIDATVPEGTAFRQLHVRLSIHDAKNNPSEWFAKDEVKQIFGDMIANPAVSDNWAKAAQAMFELPATIPEHSLRASEFARNAFLTRNLLKLRGKQALLSPPGVEPPPGYVPAKWGEFGRRGFYMDKDLALELESYEQIQKSARGLFNKYFTTPWKTMKIIMSPAAQIRNAFTNMMLNDIGGLPFYRMDIYKQAATGMWKNHDTWKDWIRQTGGGGMFANNEMAALASKFKYDLEYKDIPEILLSQASKYPKNIYNANEQLFKYAKYLHNLEKGMRKSEAAADAMIPTFNYGEITPAVAKLRGTFIPFATWTTKVIPYTFEMMVKHPVRVGKWFAMFYGMQHYALEKAGMSEEEFEVYKKQWPEYMQKGAYLLMPWRDSRGRLNMVDLTYMVPGIGDMKEMVGKGLWESFFQHPALTLPAQLLSGKEFSGAPYRHEWQTPVMKRIADAKHIWQSLMPSWFGGTDWNKYMKVASGQPGAMTMGQALASQFGMKMQPLDDEYMFKLHNASQRIHLTEMTIEMKKEIRLAGSDPQVLAGIKSVDEKIQEISEKYANIRRAFLTDGMDQGEGDEEE